MICLDCHCEPRQAGRSNRQHRRMGLLRRLRAPRNDEAGI